VIGISLLWVSQPVRTSVVNGDPRARRIRFYRDPMHPSYTSALPGKAPDCGMDLQPVFEGEVSSPTTGSPSHATPIRVSDEQLQRIGLRTAVVQRGTVNETLRTPGRVEVDENRVFPVRAGGTGTVTRIAPAIETGSFVKSGQPLLSAYGRDYTTAQRTFLYALRATENPPPAFAGQGQDPNALSLEEARRDLESIGFDKAQIEQLARSRALMLDITITAPSAGTIVARNVFPGQRFGLGDELLRIADLTHVWVAADISAGDSSYVPPGTVARILVAGAADAPLRAVVADSLPRYDTATRTNGVRLYVDNPRRLLKPGMFVDVMLKIMRSDAITVPTEAILNSGDEHLVFVEVAEGTFEPRTIDTGWTLGGVAEVRRGLAPGESVVVQGAFLLQSEQRIRHGTTGTHD